MAPKKKIVCIHLLNDYSGSPLVLSQVVQAFISDGHQVDLYTSKNSGEGFLSKLKGVSNFGFFYRWSRFKIFTLFLFFWSQFLLFFKLLKYRNEEVVFYINTILPFGAALAGKITNKKVIYHVHESSIKPAIFKKFLFGIAKKTASEAIFVSDFLREKENIVGVNCHTIYNAITAKFIFEIPSTQNPTTVLMLCSLKTYKGVNEFIQLANMLPKQAFELVLNADKKQIEHFFKGIIIPKNLSVFPSQQNVHPFYNRAKVVLNLSHPDLWVETFGMTALEAMCYKIPVIVPPVGGIAEVVQHEKNGYCISVKDLGLIKNQIKNLYTDENLYKKMASASFIRSKDFSIKTLQNSILKQIK